MLKQWWGRASRNGVSRYVYNKTIEHLQQPDTKAQWMAVAQIIPRALPEWATSVPYQIKKIAVKDAWEAKRKYKEDGKIPRCKFRSRKDKQQTIFIPLAKRVPRRLSKIVACITRSWENVFSKSHSLKASVMVG